MKEVTFMSAIRTSAFLVFLLLNFEILAQKHDVNWYFGWRAGISFQNGNPVSINNSALTTMEGTSVANDRNGNLLFYTNGNLVYTRSHKLMKNGFDLSGHSSSTQSSIIVKSVYDDSLYYLFTVPAQLGALGGNGRLCYSVINLRKDGGNGEVVQKNVILLASVCEKITAVRHANNKDVWVAVHQFGSNAYYVYPINCDGVGKPVISYAGEKMENGVANSNQASIGCMKFSRDGKKIAAAWQHWNSTTNSDSRLQVADFDNVTGKVSNAVTVSHSDPFIMEKGYGVEFSPSSKYLYYTEFGGTAMVSFGKLYQYELTASWPSTEVLITTDVNPFGTLQLGPDQKIYIARYHFFEHLSVIRKPDNAGIACDFRERGVDISPNNCEWGLPNLWETDDEDVTVDMQATSYFNLINFDDTAFCKGTQCYLNAAFPDSTLQQYYHWNSGATTPGIYVNYSGLYSVTLYKTCDTISDSVSVIVTGTSFTLGEDGNVCYGNELQLTGPDDVTMYKWNTGTSAQSVVVSDTGLYILTVADSNGCEFSDTVLVTGNGCGCSVYVPDAFTANGDGRNDVFRVYSDCIFRHFRLIILNRWGQAVFTTDDPYFTWSGIFSELNVQQNLYVWKMEYGTENYADDVVRKGNLVVLR